MADNRITKQRLRNHWTYGWWKYLLMAVLVVFGTNLYFTTTAYRPPEEKKVELYLCSGWADTEKAYTDLWPMLMELAPEQEELQIANINLTSDDYNVVMQYTTYMAAQQGDILLIPRSQFKVHASDEPESYFADLTPYIESGAFDAAGIDLGSTTLLSTTGQQGIYGVPADLLYGLVSYGLDPADSVFVVTAYSGNEETCVKLLSRMIERLKTPKPEGYDEWHAQRTKASAGSSQIFN